MRDVVREWLEKAEGDLRVAMRECRVRRNPNHDAVRFAKSVREELLPIMGFTLRKRRKKCR